MISAHPAAVLAKRNIDFFFHQFQSKILISNQYKSIENLRRVPSPPLFVIFL
jgi:hypothetical protein